MARSRRVGAVWNWLPAFRVVAEYESIHKAALVLGVSASALSRTVRLLEDALGHALFVRSATGLGLTRAGADVLKSTRDAMRRIDDVLEAPSSEPNDKPIVAAASGAALCFMLTHALGRAAHAHGSRYRVIAVDERDAVGELLRGNADLALVEGANASPEIVCEALGNVRFALYAPPGAPHDAPVVALDGLGVDSSRVVAFVPTMDAIAHVAGEASLCALLPDGLAPPSFARIAAVDARIAVHALTRRPLDASCPHAGTRALVDETRALLATMASSTRGLPRAAASHSRFLPA